MSIVREDEHGLYIQINGSKARPGGVRGYDHAYAMDDGGLKKGDKVKAYKQTGNMLTTVTLPDGTKRYWTHYAPDHYDRNENIKPLTAEQQREREEFIERLLQGKILKVIK